MHFFPLQTINFATFLEIIFGFAKYTLSTPKLVLLGSQTSVIRRGLRALGDYEFPMSSNTAGIAGTHRELVADVVETVPPWKKLLGSLLP